MKSLFLALLVLIATRAQLNAIEWSALQTFYDGIGTIQKIYENRDFTSSTARMSPSNLSPCLSNVTMPSLGYCVS